VRARFADEKGASIRLRGVVDTIWPRSWPARRQALEGSAGRRQGAPHSAGFLEASVRADQTPGFDDAN